MKRLAGLACTALLASGCALPMTDGVRSAGDVQPQREPPVVEVVPPGPAAGSSPQQIVRDFLNAQRTPDDDHAVARQFLAPGTEWDDQAGVLVYDFDSRQFVQDPADSTSFAFRFQATGSIAPDGSFSLKREMVSKPFQVARQPDGQFRLVQVPDGLFLTPGDVTRSYRPYHVHFLGRAPDGRATAQLVPDRVFLPVAAERASALVARLLAGPSDALGGAVQSAAPEGLGGSVEVVEGVVVVNLGPQALALAPRERQRLSAQLVWTLVPAGFSGVRLEVGGEPLEVSASGEVQDLSDWAKFDPAPSADDEPLYYVQNRMLRTLGGPSLPPSEVTRPGEVPVDEVAVNPVDGDLAIVSRTPGREILRVGSAAGPLQERLVKRALRSPSWGAGTQGVWVLEPGPRPILWLVRQGRAPQPVSYAQPRGAGPLSTLRVSRDGARIALVFGTGSARRLYVARVEPAGGQFQVTGPRPVAPGLTGVADVAWQSGTSLVVLASAATGDPQVVLSTVAVDGSIGPAPVQRQGLSGVLHSLAAMPGQPLVVAAEVEGRRVLFRDNGAIFRQPDVLEEATAPVYPG